jgi:5-methylthioribose kinase
LHSPSYLGVNCKWIYIQTMSKFGQITSALKALPAKRREEIAAIIETLFHGDLHPESALNDVQIADLRARLADPGPIASDDEVEAFFARFRA